MNTLDPVAVFRIEAAEVFEQIESGLLDLTRRLDDKAQIDAVFRGLHTLKGSGSMFGFDALAAFTHHCETAFDRVRKGEVPATAELVAAVLAAQDHMRALVETPNGDHQAAGDRLLELLRAAVDGKSAEPVVAAAKDALNRWRIRFSLPHNAMINGTNPLGLLDELRDLGECRIVADTAGVPPLDLLVPTELHLSWEVFLTSDQPRSAIDDVFIFVIDDMKFEVETLTDAVAPAPVAEQPAIVVPLPVATPLGTVAVPAAVVIVPAAETLPVKIETPSSPPPADARQAKASESVRVPAERLDELMDRVGELVIAQSRLRQLANSSAELALRSVSEEIERLSGELRDTMMVLRMVPVATLFSRFRRLTHDLARETGKVIELVTEGETTEVDKTVIERLADPLVHLVRNSIDHGLEPPAERLSAGKSEGGTVTLSARQSGGEVIISIKDDGRGINRQRVRAKAESSGLIQLGQVLTDSDLLQLIFAPGFSTAAQITNLSGRGVGMDVVKKTVEALRGAIDVTSHDGQGSEVSLRIPLTLAIIDGLLVRVGTGRYVIPLSAVEECLELSLEEDLRSRGRSFISLRDSLVPFLRLRELFRTGTKPDVHQKVVVISTGTERVGLVVDQIIGDHQTVIKSMSKLHQDVSTFSGATILGDGNVALILDVVHLVAAGQQQEAQLRAAG
ncbi:chemotaxis protein CheA [Rhizobium sp. VS19-DR104.2]|uniref:chemotaxis protein CheA n=2 Tax=Rhizobium TaxID=379 RepID=UPI001C5B75B5|nr:MULTISPECIES: chemotaxis protein CheA [unclassified Rhizobium]MBZ5763454.1 chemotaxis protein CheA [Rhizobium sp. VS19-DR96]MBZ5769393.1 chemotaxis protein CheA [Rhizobium sp. VS19-DR129.2]MBZ5788033.1 chemotaxis protein CheA [Rhizobium sp. VS19-DR121]MBZ5805524.1 chemotaxis protein CheA [Rhizobium sp. VS19-DR181]MBZ5821360.1 chemotaxis protein CheA [Rhizobium sp. VS19-DR183]